MTTTPQPPILTAIELDNAARRDEVQRLQAKANGKRKSPPKVPHLTPVPTPPRPSEDGSAWPPEDTVWPAWKGPLKRSHAYRLSCLDRCIQHEARRQRNSLRRRARLLWFARALELSKEMGAQQIAQRVLEAQSRQQGHQYKGLTAADRAAMERPSVAWLIPDLIPACDLTIIGGRAKVGKTRLAVAIAQAVLNGSGFLGFPAPTTPQPVILISDDQADGDTADMLTALGLWDHPALIWSRHFRLTEDNLDGLLADIDANPGATVILDSLRSIGRCLPHGENDPEIGATLYDLKQAVIDRGGTPLLIHHCNKSDSLTGTEALSGHNAIAGACNTIFTLHYLPGEGGLLKDDPQRRLVREGRSGAPLDVVITPTAGTGTFHSVCNYSEWRQQVAEARKVANITVEQQQALEVLDGEPERWWTVRDVVAELGLNWTGAAKGHGQSTRRWLERLVELDQAEDTRTGNAKTFRSSRACTHPTNLTILTNPLQDKVSPVVTPDDKPDKPLAAQGLTYKPLAAEGLTWKPIAAQGLTSGLSGVVTPPDNRSPIAAQGVCQVCQDCHPDHPTLGSQVDVRTAAGRWKSGYRVADVLDTTAGIRLRVEQISGSDFRVVSPPDLRLSQEAQP